MTNKIRILYIDDYDLDRELVKDALETFQAAPDGFDLIITDMTMPEMTRDKPALSVKKIRPGIPVILSTGSSETVNVKTADHLLIDGFLMKPVDQEKMATTVRKILNKGKNSA